MSEREIPIKCLVIDPAIQPRLADVDRDHVAVLAEAGPQAWPAVVIVERNGEAVLVDGRHRVEAARLLGVEAVTCRVEALPEDGDLRGVAFALNRTHGKPLTLAERKAEAMRLLTAGSRLSNRELARQCGLSDKTVGAMREDRQATAENPQLTHRVGRDGKVRAATRSASTKPINEKSDTATSRRTPLIRESGSIATVVDPSMAALQGLVTQVADFLDEHAGDELHTYLANDLSQRWPGADQREKAEAMRTLGEQLVATADRLDRATSNDEKEQAA